MAPGGVSGAINTTAIMAGLPVNTHRARSNASNHRPAARIT